jgi:8-oxo-dGTP diphosphatase
VKREHNCYLAADSLVFVGNEVLLVQRKNDPFRGRWAVPGGFVDLEERLEAAARRELEEETGINGIPLRFFGAYGEPGRDPRGRTITFIYWTRLPEKPEAKAADDAADCRWFDLDHLPELAFDHNQILKDAVLRMKELE